MFGSLSLYRRFDSRVIHSGRERLPANLRALADGLEAGRAPGVVFRPAPDLHWPPFLISLSSFGLLLSLPLLLGSGSWWRFRGVGFTPQPILIGLGILGILGFLGYYTFWINLLGPLHVKRNLASYFIHLGPEGILRRDGNRYTFLPWAIIRGATLSLGGSATGDASDGRRGLELQIEGRTLFTPCLVKGYGAGALVDDWIDYREDDLIEMARIIQMRGRSR